MKARGWMWTRDLLCGLALALAVLAALAVPPGAKADPPELTGGGEVTFNDCLAGCVSEGVPLADCQLLCTFGFIHCYYANPASTPPCVGTCFLGGTCTKAYSVFYLRNICECV